MKQKNGKWLKIISLLVTITFLISCQKKEESNIEESSSKEIAGNIKNAATAVVVTCSGSTVDHVISLATARGMIDKYQVAVKNRAVASIYDTGGWVNAETFPSEYIRLLLAQPNCCSFRIYNGIGTDNKQHSILVGVDKAGRDILYTSYNVLAITTADPPPPPMILNLSSTCPDFCIGHYRTGP